MQVLSLRQLQFNNNTECNVRVSGTYKKCLWSETGWKCKGRKVLAINRKTRGSRGRVVGSLGGGRDADNL